MLSLSLIKFLQYPARETTSHRFGMRLLLRHRPRAMEFLVYCNFSPFTHDFLLIAFLLHNRFETDSENWGQ